MADKIAKFLASLDERLRRRLAEKLCLLRKDPRHQPGVKKLSGGLRDYFRLRIGDIRVIYFIDDVGDVCIVDIGYRDEIYR